LWGILDLRNNIYYFKAICRNANLYWGKSLFLKRQDVTGDPEFIKFMKFCDDSLPLDGYIYNCVSEVMQNTPYNYLASTQVNFNLQPRPNNYRQYLKGKDEPYYIFYKTTTYEVFGVPVAALKFFKQYNKDAFIMTQ
jgi:hypothetical protein